MLIRQLILGLAFVGCLIWAGCSILSKPQAALSSDISTFHMLDARAGWALTGGLPGQQRLLLTRNGGQTWRDVTPGGAAGTGRVMNEEVYFLDARHGWVSTGQGDWGLWRTINGGRTWSYVSTTNFLQNFQFRDAHQGVACSADYGAGNAYYRFFETQDGGTSWQPVLITPSDPGETGLPPGTIHLCNLCTDRIDFRLPGNVIITHGDMGDEQPKDAVRLTVSANLGKNWRNVNLPLPSEKYRTWLVSSVEPVFFDDRSGDLAAHLVQESADGNTLISNAMVVYLTRDGGKTWAPGTITIDSGGEGQANDQFDLVTTRVAFRTTGRNLLVTHDGARSWHRLPSNLIFDQPDLDRNVLQLDFVDATHGWVLILENSGDPPEGANHLYRTMDGGATWSELPLKIE